MLVEVTPLREAFLTLGTDKGGLSGVYSLVLSEPALLREP